jgi:hypothetical protein
VGGEQWDITPARKIVVVTLRCDDSLTAEREDYISLTAEREEYIEELPCWGNNDTRLRVSIFFYGK